MSTLCQLTLYFVGDIVVCLFVVGPTFTTTSLTYNLLVDSDAVFICSVSANPSPVVTWYKDGSRLYGDMRISVSSDGTRLTVADIRPEDAGTYTCVASNYISTVRHSGTLKVIGVYSSHLNVSKVFDTSMCVQYMLEFCQLLIMLVLFVAYLCGCLVLLVESPLLVYIG